ncbi:glucose-1-phosphate cytidylyltransferase, partial [Candidatus Pacearchaeota archaeon]|nr:glucose-1-phosphate cytidylyltransferase [Candidatus Pacearchaeota archaeon]
MKLYSYHGFNDFILCLGYKGEKIKEYFDSNNHENWNIQSIDTGLETNTGGRIKKIEKYIGDEDFMVTYGDGVSDINIKELIKFHRNKGKIATMTCINFRSNYGIIDIDEKENILGFNEKPFMNMWINGGFFVFNKKVFDYLGEDYMLEREPIKELTKDNELAAFKYEGFWECMDTYKDTRTLNNLQDKGKAKWMVWDKNVKA